MIEPGGLHWTAAGRGIVHEEVPDQVGNVNHVLQIFVNLAADRQEIAPFTLSLQPADVPVVHLPGVRIRISLGRLFDHESPLTPPTDVSLFDISFEDGAHVKLPVPEGTTVFVMSIRGQLSVDGEGFDPGRPGILVFEAVDRSRIVVLAAVEGPAQAVVFAGKPLRQPVHWQGSMAMASPVALLRATAEFKTRSTMTRLRSMRTSRARISVNSGQSRPTGSPRRRSSRCSRASTSPSNPAAPPLRLAPTRAARHPPHSTRRR